MTDVNSRLHTLERDLNTMRRRLRWGLPCTFAGGIALATLMGSSMTATEHIRAKRVDVVGDDGRTVLALSTDANGGRVDLWTPAGHNVARLSANTNGGDLAMWANDGTTHAGLWATTTGGAMALWQADGQRLARVDAKGMQMHGDVHVRGDNGTIALVADAGRVSATHANITSSLDHAGVRIDDNATLTATALTLGTDGHTMAVSPDGLQAGASELTFSDAGPALSHKGVRMAVIDDGVQVTHGSATLMQARSSDGLTTLAVHEGDAVASLSVMAGEAAVRTAVDGVGAGVMQVDAGGARTDLVGSDDAVTLAAHRDEPLLVAGGGGLTLMADGPSGAIRLGAGEAGGIRLVAGTDGSVPAVEVLDRAGLRVAAMSMEAAGAGAFVAGYGGTPTAIMRGRSIGGRLDLRGEHGTVLVRSGAGPMAALLGPDGRTQAMLAGTGTGGVLNLMDTQGMPVVLTGASAEGRGGAAAFRNADGDVVVTAGAGPDADGRVRVVNPGDNRASTLAPPTAGAVHAGAME